MGVSFVVAVVDKPVFDVVALVCVCVCVCAREQAPTKTHTHIQRTDRLPVVIPSHSYRALFFFFLLSLFLSQCTRARVRVCVLRKKEKKTLSV